MAKSHIKFAIGFLLAGAIVCRIAPSAQATMVSWGDPFVGHSWDAAWSESSSANFNSLQATILAPPGATAQFEAPGLSSLSSDWAVGSLSADHKSISASGPSAQNLVFSTRFIGSSDDYTPDNKLLVDFRFTHDGQVVDEKLWAFDNVNGWVDPPGVPEGGASALLLGLSGLGIAAFRRVVR